MSPTILPIKSANSALTRKLVAFGAFGLVFPFFLVDSIDICSTAAMRHVVKIVPVIQKFSAISFQPNLTCIYFASVLVIAPILAAVQMRREPWNERIAFA